MTVVVPQTALDLNSILCDKLELKPNEVERHFDLISDVDNLVIKIHRNSQGKPVWIEPTMWHVVNDYVRELSGAWDPQAKLWKIPLANIPTPIPTPMPTNEKGESNALMISAIPVDGLLSLPFQVRTWDQDPTLAEMAETIKLHGLLEPLVVRPRSDGRYEIVNGERRLKACKLAGLTEVPCVVKPMSDQEAYECQMIENIQRKDLADIEKAYWLKHMLEKFPEAYPTQEALAKTIGKTQQWVSYHLAMLKLPEDFTTRVVKETGQALTEGQAREILAIPPEKRGEVIEKIKEKTSPQKVEEPLPEPVECSFCEVQTFFPIMFNDKPFCCLEHLEKAKQAGKLKAPSARKIRKMRQPKPKPLLTGFDVPCPECHIKLLIEHHEFPDGKVEHKIIKELPN